MSCWGDSRTHERIVNLVTESEIWGKFSEIQGQKFDMKIEFGGWILAWLDLAF